MVAALKDAGTWKARINKSAVDQRLDHHQKAVQRVTKPPQKFWELPDYLLEYGDPTTNKKGHTQVVWRGMEGVFVQGPKVWTLAEEQVDELDLQTTLNDGSTVLGENQLAEQMQQQAINEFESVQGTGQSSHSLERDRLLEMMQSMLVPVVDAESGSAGSSGTPLGLAAPVTGALPPPVAPSEAKQADPFNAGFSLGWRGQAPGGLSVAAQGRPPTPCDVQPPARRGAAEALLPAAANDTIKDFGNSMDNDGFKI